MPQMQIAGGTLHPSFDHDMGRINVILGANGSGKSSLLRDMRGNAQFRQITNLKHQRFIDGGRVLRPIGHSQLQRHNMQNAGYQVAESMFQDPNYDQAHQHAQMLLEALCQDHLRVVRMHSDECLRLSPDGKPVSVPRREESRLDVFKKLFEETFPSILLEFDVDNVRLICMRNGSSYSPEAFSTGERQIFLLLGKFILDKEPSLFLIDEPEQNLNPKLADRFWGIIERYRLESSFIYTTHALHFALRSGVERVFVLTPKASLNVTSASVFHDLSRSEREELLGSIPSIVVSNRVLLVEGVEDGLDEPIYRYILQRPDIRVISMGDCYQVRNAVNGQKGWDHITAGVEMRGIIDRDFRSDNQIAELTSSKLVALRYHEAESLLCHPAAVAELSAKMWPQVGRITAEKVLQEFLDILNRDRYGIAIRRAFEAKRNEISLSAVDRSTMAALKSDADAKTAFRKSFDTCASYVGTINAEQLLELELQRINEAIVKQDVDAILCLVEGKVLLGKVKQLLNPGKEDILALYEFHFPSADLAPFKLVRQNLLSLYENTHGPAVPSEAHEIAA